MQFHYEATSDFMESISEVETLITLASSDDVNRTLFLKLAIVLVVTKFQVFVEKSLNEFRFNLNGIKSHRLPLYMKMNSLKLSVLESNPLVGLQKNSNFSEEKKSKIVDYLNSISFINDEQAEITESFKFKTKYPLGKTGKSELIGLLIQIDGDANPFKEFTIDDFDKIDSVLQTRHLIAHQDRFTGTETTVKEQVDFLKNLVEYIDDYLYSKYSEFTN